MSGHDFDLITALEQVIGAEALERARRWRPPYNPADNLDEQTLRNMHGGLSRLAVREARRPRSFTPDSLGYLPNGSWTPGSAA